MRFRIDGLFAWPKIRALLAYGLGPALGLLSGPILARSLGPEGRGQFASVMEPPTLAGALATIGLPSAVTYFIARGGNPRTVLVRAVALGLPTATATYGILIWYSGEVSRAQGIPRWLLLTAWLLVTASAVIQILRSYWQGLGSWRRLDIERFSFAIMRFAAVIVVAILGFSSIGPYVFGALAAFLLAGALLLSPQLLHSDNRISGSAKGMYKYSVAAAAGTIAVVCSNRLDQALLPITAPSDQLGFYAVAVTVAEVPVVCAALAGRNALTLASKGFSIYVILREILPFIVAGVGLLVALYIGAPFYIPLLFGPNFAASISAIQILTIGTAYSLVTFTSIAIISGRGRPGLSSWIPLSSVAVTATSFAVIGNKMTSTSASYVSTSSQILAAVVGTLLVWYVGRPSSKKSPSRSSTITDPVASKF